MVLVLRMSLGGNRDGSEAKSIGCSSRGLGFQNRHGSSQLSVVPVSGYLTPSAGFCRHHRDEGKIFIYIKKKI